jgi:membrane protease YdiL (CAAX protease family)
LVDADADVGARLSLREPVVTFLASITLASALFWAGRVVPVIRHNLHACIAVIFLYAPVVAGRFTGRRFDFQEAGLRLDPLRTNLAVLAAVVVVTFPLFVLAFFQFYNVVCGIGSWAGGDRNGLMGTAHELAQRLCPGAGWQSGTGAASGLAARAAQLRLPGSFALLAANQVLVVALPEEMFFRGYLLGRLEEVWPPGRRLLGAPVGGALVTSAALFALGHFLVDFNPARLAVFFPGLVFAWMRARTGSIAAGTAYHAMCNLLADVLHTSYFS